MARDFCEVVEKIKAVAPPEFNEKLEKSLPFWAPEVLWYNLTGFVNKNMTPCSKNPTSVKVYALLCGVCEDEMKRRFIANGD